MTQKEKAALKEQQKNNVATVNFLQRAINTFGDKLWEVTGDVALAVKCANTDDTALDGGMGAEEIRKLAAPALYYMQGQYGLQLLLAYGDNTWGYAGLARDKDGDPIIDDEHTYDVKNVKARREFEIPDGDGAKIALGFETTKAFAVS